MIALFYDTVRRFLEEVQEFAGMKRKTPGTPEGEQEAPEKI
jgi:hypothetical protein